MRTLITLFALFFSVVVIAQPTVSVNNSSSDDIIISLPTNTMTLTGTAVEKNPGHPILDTTWTQISGPAATITNPSNRMNTTVTNLVKGNYVFMLTATDKKGSASATINVHVVAGSLPIQLAYFNVAQDAGEVTLTWRTNMESNNSHFIIQKSVDGSHFTDIATVASKAVNGNSAIHLDYSYQFVAAGIKAGMNSWLLIMTLLAAVSLVNKLNRKYKGVVVGLVCLFLFSCTKSVSTPAPTNTVASKTYYRLVQVDLDGNTNYSPVQVINGVQ